MRAVLSKAFLGFAVGSFIALLSLPLAALLLKSTPALLVNQLFQPMVLEALKLSLITSLSATAIVVLFGTPVAYLLATRNFFGKKALEVLVDLPMVLPPTVAGLALLLAFGRSGLIGSSLEMFGISLPFTTLGVVLAQAFMSVPFFVAPVRAGFLSVDRKLIDAAKTLRASEMDLFFRVLLPLSTPSLVAGVAMSCARALGEFGATITFAGNLPGVTQTMPLAVYVALQSDLEAAIMLSVLLLILSCALLFALRSSRVGLFERNTSASGATS